MRKHFWKILSAFLVLVVVILVIFSGSKQISVREVLTEKVKVKKTIVATGMVTSKNESNLSFSTGGKLADINISKGEQVERGAFIAYVDNYSESQSTQALKDARDVAIRDKELFVEEREENIDLYGGEDAYDIQVRKLDELISKAEASYQAQVGALGKTYMYAPFKGTIVDIYKDIGETASASETIVKIADLENLIFEIELEQEDFGLLQKGQKVEIQLDPFEDETFAGEVSEVPLYADSSNGANFSVEIKILGENSKKALLGMSGDAYIVLEETSDDASALPFDKILFDEQEKPYVYVVRNGVVFKQEVTTGLQGDLYTELKSEITDKIVEPVDNNIKIDVGTKVKLIDE